MYRMDGNENLAREIIRYFLDDAPQQMADMREQVAELQHLFPFYGFGFDSLPEECENSFFALLYRIIATYRSFARKI